MFIRTKHGGSNAICLSMVDSGMSILPRKNFSFIEVDKQAKNLKSYKTNFHLYFQQQKKDVSILSPYSDRYMSNLTIMFNTSGAGVQVSCGYGMLHVKFSAPPIMFVSPTTIIKNSKKKIKNFKLKTQSLKVRNRGSFRLLEQ